MFEQQYWCSVGIYFTPNTDYDAYKTLCYKKGCNEGHRDGTLASATPLPGMHNSARQYERKTERGGTQ